MCDDIDDSKFFFVLRRKEDKVWSYHETGKDKKVI
jgi:hypothetical protein